MLSLLIAGLVAAPQWTTDLRLRPRPLPDLELSAEGAPRGTVVLPARRKATLVVTGPGTLRVQAWGLMRKVGARLSDPGKLQVWVDTVQRKTIELQSEAAAGWYVIGKPRWRVGRGQQVEFPLTAGEHSVFLQHQLKRGNLGYGLLVEVTPDEPAATGAPVVSEGPAATEGPAEAPVGRDQADPSEPELVGTGPAGGTPADDEAMPRLLTSPQAALLRSGLIVTTPDDQHRVRGPDGVHSFYRVTIDPGMSLTATGPGTVLLEVHAHRARDNPETLEPVVLGFLLDDVLVETLSLATPATNEFTVAGAPYALSDRVAVRVAVPLGLHRLQLSLSDNAVLGASVRPRFLVAGDDEPEVLDLGAARARDLVAGDDEPEVLDLGTARARDLVTGGATGGAVLGIVAGMWAPTAFGEVGAGATLEGGIAIPVGNTRLLVQLSASLGYSDASRQIEDDNVATGNSRVRIRQTTAPVLAGATWHAPMPVGGLSVELGVGAGAVLNWTEARYRRVDSQTNAGVTPAFSAWGGAGIEVGPGSILLRAGIIAALPYSDDTVTDFDPGAAFVGTGFRFNFDR